MTSQSQVNKSALFGYAQYAREILTFRKNIILRLKFVRKPKQKDKNTPGYWFGVNTRHDMEAAGGNKYIYVYIYTSTG